MLIEGILYEQDSKLMAKKIQHHNVHKLKESQCDSFKQCNKIYQWIDKLITHIDKLIFSKHASDSIEALRVLFIMNSIVYEQA